MTSPGYRPEIDGLRAIAVLAVIIFHAKAAFLPGGFLGVDIFFLISGYLITGIVAREAAQHNFSIARFYERRARRILPALIAVLLVCIPFAWAWMMPDELISFGRSLVATNLFFSNYFFRSDVDYFAEAAELKALIHTWSLAVEEQFYLFFPLLLVALLKFRRTVVLAALVSGAALSLALAEYWARVDPSSNFYLLFPRAWELLLGSLIVLSPPPAMRKGHRQLLSVLGMLMVLAPLFIFNETIPLPGLLGLIPSGGAALLILFAGEDTAVGTLLGSRLPVAIGLVSYSAYLWHQPVFVFARLRLYEGIDTLTWFGLIVVTFVLSWASWRFVESPFRDKRMVSVRQLASAAIPLTLLLIVAGFALQRTNGLPQRIPETALALEHEATDTRDANRKCQFDDAHPFNKDRACHMGPAGNEVVIWGDSHATALASGLMPVLAERNVGSAVYASSSCVPVLGYDWELIRKNCRSDNQKALEAIVNDPGNRVVVLLARWTFFVEHTSFDNGEGGVEHGVSAKPIFDADTPDLKSALQLTVTQLLKARKHVLLVYPVPEVGWNVTKVMSRRIVYDDQPGRQIATSWARYEERNRGTLALLNAVTPQPGLGRFDPADFLCVDRKKCVATDADGPLYFDDDHLSRHGARFLAGPIIAALP